VRLPGKQSPDLLLGKTDGNNQIGGKTTLVMTYKTQVAYLNIIFAEMQAVSFRFNAILNFYSTPLSSLATLLQNQNLIYRQCYRSGWLA
jgi:hypothetical protein